MRKIDYLLLTQTGWLNELMWRVTGRSFGYQFTAKRWVLSRDCPFRTKPKKD
jgi:hypothetical protein